MKIFSFALHALLSFHRSLFSFVFFALLLALCPLLFVACGYDFNNPCDQNGSVYNPETCYGCTNECSTNGAKQCSGSGYQTCGNTDADPCLEWGTVTACGTGEFCSAGQCTTLGCAGDEYIDMGIYRMAKYEASHPDATVSSQGSDNSMACSQAGVLPWVSVDWNGASSACTAAGGRLCGADEWGDTCDGVKGSGGSTYPYGNTYQGSTCNGYDAGKGGAVSTGSMSGCVSGFGAYDLSGNVWEWTNEASGSNRVVRGGSFGGSYDSLACAYEAGGNPSYAYSNFGFRCCQDK